MTTAPFEHGTPTWGAHPCTETVYIFSFAFARLKGALHDSILTIETILLCIDVFHQREIDHIANRVSISEEHHHPVDPHPKFPDKSALEIIMTTLHAGGKFDSKAYETSGGLHGVGISVVNALSDKLIVEIARDQTLYTQTYSRGHATSKLSSGEKVHIRRGTTIRFHPDPDIFGP